MMPANIPYCDHTIESGRDRARKPRLKRHDIVPAAIPHAKNTQTCQWENVKNKAQQRVRNAYHHSRARVGSDDFVLPSAGNCSLAGIVPEAHGIDTVAVLASRVNFFPLYLGWRQPTLGSLR